MALEFERRVVEVVQNILGASLGGGHSSLAKSAGPKRMPQSLGACFQIYYALTGLELPEEMRQVERRTVDAVLKVGEQCRVLEVDEKQHFNKFRAETFRH